MKATFRGTEQLRGERKALLDEVRIAEKWEAELFRQLTSQRAKAVGLRSRMLRMFEEEHDDKVVVEETAAGGAVEDIDCCTVSESIFGDWSTSGEYQDAVFDLWSSTLEWTDPNATGPPEAKSNQDLVFSEASFSAPEERA